VRPGPRAPSAVLLFTSELRGEIRECGCQGKPGGGLARRAGFLRTLRAVWPDVPVAWLDSGNLGGDGSEPGRARTEITAAAMKELGYAAVNVAHGEAAWSAVELEGELPLVSSNLYRKGGNLRIPPYREVKLGELRLGVLGLSALLRPPPKDWDARDPAAEAAAISQFLAPGVDYLVALASLPRAEALRVAARVPEIDLVLAGWGATVTPYPIEEAPVPVLYGGDQGKWLTEVRLYAGEAGLEAVEYVVHYLGREVPEDPAFLRRQEEGAERLNAALLALAKRTAREARAPEGERFVTAMACRRCHVEAYRVWSGTAHAGAYRALEEEERHLEPTCQLCHTTGFGETGGFSNPVRDRFLRNVQCEACHGAGADHAADPSLPYPTPPAAPRCGGCHDSENDPDFSLHEAWPHIAHGGEEGSGGAR
jgi:hypothetical protein